MYPAPPDGTETDFTAPHDAVVVSSSPGPPPILSQIDIAELVHDAIILRDTNARIIYWNAGAERLYGWDRHEALGQDCHVLLRPNYPVPISDVHSSLDKTGGWEGVLQHRRRDGTDIYIESRQTLQRDRTGQPTGVLCINRDIGAQQEVTDAVRLNEMRLSELIERAPFGVYIVDSSFRIAHMNASSQSGAFQNVMPLIGRDFGEAMRILWPDDVARDIIGCFRHTLDTGEPFISADFIRPRDDIDSVESYEWELHRITLPDGQSGVVCYYFDSTPLRRAEMRLRDYAGEVEDLNDRLKRAMAESHHRIKNNLQVLSAMVDMQRMSDGDTVPKAELDRLGVHIRTLAGLHDLLTAEAKAGADGDTVQLGRSLDKMLPMFRSAGVKHLDCHFEDGLPVPLRQCGSFLMLVNELVSNATKHGNGNVTLRLSREEARPAESERRKWARARLVVTDDGPGFPPDFDPAEAAATGLELVASLAQWDLQGRVEYTNRPGGGAQVIVTFPLICPNQPIAKPERRRDC
jgi:PAS domain S-box-containing protein